LNQRFEFKLFADYYQFYLQDENADGDLSNSWTPEATERLLAVAPGTIGVGTARNMDVPVVVEIADTAPSDDLLGWDQVNECSLDAPSGRIVIAGCTDYFPDAARIKLTPGSYRARVYYGGLNAPTATGLQGSDHYRIVFWKGDPAPPTVIKQRPKSETASGS
jgi:hypothetical protein